MHGLPGQAGNDEGGTVLGMTRERILYLILGALVVAVIVLGYQVYQDRKNTTGIDINIGERGISIEKK
jgi:predicted negative regulator of RcsB-dependent stress response